MQFPRLLLLFCLVILLSMQAVAQEATEPSIPPTPIVTETPLPTETETSTPTATDLPTSTETATATEAPTSTETATIVLATERETTQGLTPEVTGEVTSEVGTATEAATTTATEIIPVDASLTPTVTSTGQPQPFPIVGRTDVIPPDNLSVLRHTDFPDFTGWQANAPWENVQIGDVQAIALGGGADPLVFTEANLMNSVISVRVLMQNEPVQIQVRKSAEGVYTAILDPAGVVSLWRDAEQLTAQYIGSIQTGAWYTLSVTTYYDMFHVTVNGAIVLAISEPPHMGEGQIVIGTGRSYGSRVIVDAALVQVMSLPQGNQASVLQSDFTVMPMSTPITATNVTELRDALATCTLGTTLTIDLLANTTYLLTEPYFTDHSGPTGLPLIRCNLTINGHGATIARSTNASVVFRIIAQKYDSQLTINNLTLSNGNSPLSGGAIYSLTANLTLDHVVFINNHADLNGGAIHFYDYSIGIGTIVSSEFVDNSAGNLGGAITGGNFTITHTRFAQNSGSGANAVNLGSADSLTTPNYVNESCFENNTGGYVDVHALPASDLQRNWWGDPLGPATSGPIGSREIVSGGANTANFYTSRSAVACGANPPPIANNVIVVSASASTQSVSNQLELNSFNITQTNTGIPFTSDGTCTIREAILSANNSGTIPDGTDGDPDPTDCQATEFDPTLEVNLIAVELFPDNTYAISAPLDAISSKILIRRIGNSGLAIIERSEGTPPFRIFEVTSTGSLTLENIIISNGYAEGNGGGILNAGKLTLTNSAVIGNYATENGGGIYNTDSGRLTINNSLIETNATEGSGAAIYHEGLTTSSITDTCIVDNWGFTDNSSIFTTSTIAVENNWWGMDDGASGVGSGQGEAVRGNVTISSYRSSPPTFNGEACKTSLIILEGTWNTDQQGDIFKGAYYTGEALATLTASNTDSPIAAFRRVMVNEERVQIKFILGGNSAGCDTSDFVDSPLMASVTCGGIDEFTAVHELGHVFIESTDNQLLTEMHVTVWDSDNPDNREIVFGQTRWRDPVTNALNDDWYRGQRGWGSHAPWFRIDDPTVIQIGPCGTPATTTPTPFQKNPCHAKDWLVTQLITGIELEEAAADMFLNWVYKKLNRGGFENVDWRTGENIADPTEPGTIRFLWMNIVMNSIVED